MNHHGARTTALTGTSIILRAIMPVSLLILTCCMAQVEAGVRPQAGNVPSPQMSRVDEQPDNQPATISMASDRSDPVEEGRMLLGRKAAESGGKKSPDKEKLPAKRLDASAEEEEDDEDDEEEADEETTTTKGSPRGGPGMASRAKSIQTDFDSNVRATLKEVVPRGAVLSVVVSLQYQGGAKDKRGKDKQESEYLTTSSDGAHTHLLDYETGTTYSIKKFDGFYGGRMKAGQEEKTLRATFDAPPKNVKTVGITIAGIGTFEDVRLGASGGTGSEGVSDEDEEDEEDEDDEDDEDDEEEDSKGFTGKKGAKKPAKKPAK